MSRCKGFKHSIETITKMKEHKHSEETKSKIRAQGPNIGFTGHHHTTEVKKLISKNRIGKGMGEKAHSWQGGKSFEN